MDVALPQWRNGDAVANHAESPARLPQSGMAWTPPRSVSAVGRTPRREPMGAH